MANYIPAVPGPVTRPITASQAPSVTSGPTFYPANQAIRAKLPQQQGQTLHAAGGVYGSLTNIAGDTSFGTGRTMWNSGAPVHNPSTGPVFQQKPAPVRFILPPWQPRARRIGTARRPGNQPDPRTPCLRAAGSIPRQAPAVAAPRGARSF